MSVSSRTLLARREFLVTACTGIAAACAPARPAGSSASPPPAGAGTPPDFELSTLSGGHEHLADHLGKKVILIDFWATFCEPCLLALPNLDAL